MPKFLEKALTALGYRYFTIQYQPFGLDHAIDIRRFLRGIREVEVVFDVGANEGQTATHYAQVFPCAEIYSFEPVQAIYNKLIERVKKWPRINPIHSALGDVNREIRITLAELSVHNSLRNASTASDATVTERIHVQTLDCFLAEREIDHIDLLKTDTEGFDLQVLKGGAVTLTKGKIQFILSEVTFNEEDRIHSSFFQISEYLHEFGFEFVDLYDHDYVSFAPRRPPLGYCNALFYKAR